MPALFSKFFPRQQNLPAILAVFKRYGHARIMTRTPNETTWKVSKDQMHFYLFLGLVTWGGSMLVVNSLFGPCQLCDTPDDYEPRYWEYEQRPMQQLLCRYFLPSPHCQYEVRLAMIDSEARKLLWQKEERRARHLMSERQDYKAWYYVPYKAKWIEWSNWEMDAMKKKFPEFTRDATT